MESRVAGKPDTIMIQLVSQQPSSSGQMQAMPISVQAIPLNSYLPGREACAKFYFGSDTKSFWK